MIAGRKGSKRAVETGREEKAGKKINMKSDEKEVLK